MSQTSRVSSLLISQGSIQRDGTKGAVHPVGAGWEPRGAAWKPGSIQPPLKGGADPLPGAQPDCTAVLENSPFSQLWEQTLPDHSCQAMEREQSSEHCWHGPGCGVSQALSAGSDTFCVSVPSPELSCFARWGPTFTHYS